MSRTPRDAAGRERRTPIPGAPEYLGIEFSIEPRGDWAWAIFPYKGASTDRGKAPTRDKAWSSVQAAIQKWRAANKDDDQPSK